MESVGLPTLVDIARHPWIHAMQQVRGRIGERRVQTGQMYTAVSKMDVYVRIFYINGMCEFMWLYCNDS